MNYNKIIENEYLITNGIGGFISASITGANTRKYHAILNASLNPPVNRHVLLSKIETTILTDEFSYTLESTEYKDNILDNSNFLVGYNNMPIPTFEYKVGNNIITKKIAMKYGENTSAVTYSVKTNENPITIQTKLHLNCRDHHDLSEVDSFNYDIEIDNSNLFLNSNSGINLFISGFGNYLEVNEWSEKEFYRIEERRGQDDEDVNYIPGYYEIEIPAFSDVSFSIVASTNPINITGDEVVNSEIKRREELTSHEDDPLVKELNIACDQFIVHRQSTNSKTVIAGYPWFTDWGRDTMIALPGLTLSTGRYDDAKNIITTFIKYLDQGLIPNMFPDDNVDPMYNTIDGTLWLFIAVYQYFNATHDMEFIKEIYSDLEGIIENHIVGTKYNIRVDKDGLLEGGNEATQLTWMDVKIDGQVVTPRHGKAVEINALWYNALNIMKELAIGLNLEENLDLKKYSDQCLESFNMKFWNKELNCLYDLIQGDEPVDFIRPNQIFAVSLPFRILPIEKEKLVIKKVEETLLTPFGLRSLSQDNKDYKSHYGGDVYKRDYAYHQGTVWGWLIGPYLEAHYKTYNDKDYISDKLQGLILHLKETGLGTISEVFSGDYPHKPGGCFAQAWSVSEFLRVYKMIQ